MTFLPIVERELRVGARRRTVGWSRVSAAGLALAIFLLLMLLHHAGRGSFGSSLGQVQFAVLSWLSFIYACGAGLFLTSDALSEEKREGTLGLLFLTDLRGYDVVLGKLMAGSTRAFYALLAAFPILALPLLMGGVAVGVFWRAVAVICNTLFLSIAIGLFVSSVSRDSRRAMNGVLLALLILLGILPMADLALAGWNPSSFHARMSFVSPGHLFVALEYMRPPGFWLQLAAQHALGWLFLGLACWCTPRAWQEKIARPDAPNRPPRDAASPRARAGAFARTRDPVRWLATRERWFRRLVWGVSLAALVLLVWAILNDDDLRLNSASRAPGSSSAASMIIIQVFGRVLVPIIELWVALHASRFFLDAVRNGAMELILVSPVGPDRLVWAQWASLRRMFAMPALVAACYSIAAAIALVLNIYLSMARARAPAGVTLMENGFVIEQLVSMACGMICFFANLAALAWFGMWMGLTNRKPAVAVLKTVCFVVVLPKIALLFVQGFVMFAGTVVGPGSGVTTYTIGAVIVCVLTVIKDALFIAFACNRLFFHFREAVASEGRPAQIPGWHPPPPPPPVWPGHTPAASAPPS